MRCALGQYGGEDYYEQAAAEAAAAAQAAIDTEAARAEWRKQRRQAMGAVRRPMGKLTAALDARPINVQAVGEQTGHLARGIAGIVTVFGQNIALTAGGKPGSMSYRTGKRLYRKARELLKRAIGKEPAFNASWANEILLFRRRAGLEPPVLIVANMGPVEQEQSKEDLLEELRSQVDEYMAEAGVTTPQTQEQRRADIALLRSQVAMLDQAAASPAAVPTTELVLGPPPAAEEPILDRLLMSVEENPVFWGVGTAGAFATGYVLYRIFKARRPR